jgi:glycosyltransferase involved in cell wall biosynthesis
LRILIINKHLKDYLGGSEVQSDIIACRLTGREHKVIYLAVNGFQKDYSVPYKVIGTSLNFLDLINIFKVERPDIIYWRYNRTKLLKSVIAAKLCRMKIVFAISGPSDFEIWFYSKRKNLRPFELIKHTIGSVFYEIDYLINYLGFYFIDGVITQLNNQTNKLPVSREITIPNSVNLTNISFTWDRPYVVWVSNLKSTKNPEIFFKLAKEFESSGIDFIMVGKIQDKKYEIVLNDATKPSNLRYLGYKTLEETNGIIASSLFLVHTCDPEGFPNVMIQAWAFGKPTISLNYDPDNLIEQNQLGSFSRDFVTLVKDTRRFIEDQTLRTAVGSKAKEFSANLFNPKVNSDKIERFLFEILNNKA